MKNILFINGHMNTGGVEKSLLDILRCLDYERYNVDLLLLEELGDYADEIPPEVHIHLKSLKDTYGSLGKSLWFCIKNRNWFAFKMRIVFLLMKLMGQKAISLAKSMLTGGRHYDCVIGFRPGICTQIAAFAVNADTKIIWWHHGEINVEQHCYLECAKACDNVVCVSKSCSDLLFQAFPPIAQKIAVIPNMIDNSYIARKAAEFSPYSRSDVVHIVTLCRLSPEKHVENTIAAAQKLKEVGIAFQWHLVGDGAKADDLHQAVISAGVAGHVFFEGNQPNPYPYLKCADLFVHPSYVESQGIVILEAMALGVPCVVTKSLGPCEFIQDGVNGLLTEQSPESLSEKVLEILTNKELYRRIKAHTHCPAQFSLENVLSKINFIMENRNEQ